MPLNVLPWFLFGCALYWLANLNGNTFGTFLGILSLHSVTSMALGLMISACVPSVEIGAALGPVVVILLLLFGGFYINLDSLPIVANWVPYINYIRYTFEALCVNEFAGETFTCGGGGRGCLTNGDEVLRGLSFGGQTSPSSALFGLGMVLLTLLVIAVLVLELSRTSYMSLGHKGKKYSVKPDDVLRDGIVAAEITLEEGGQKEKAAAAY